MAPPHPGTILNVHSISLSVPPERAGALIDTLGSEVDAL